MAESQARTSAFCATSEVYMVRLSTAQFSLLKTMKGEALSRRSEVRAY